MITQPFRLPAGGKIDRSRTLSFAFDGTRYTGHPGDTLASALLANGVRIAGRSFKRHRPRGLLALGTEECNALVQVGSGATVLPNVPATLVELYDGLEAKSLNCWPSASVDVGAALDAIARFLPAGFYYKTFMWPAGAWRHYEHLIRRAAGIGRTPAEPDPDRYEHRFDHCDVLVIGAGPAGIAAACEAGRTGARVLLVDECPAPGGQLLWQAARIDGRSALDWVEAKCAALAAMPNVRLLARATAFGYHDHNFVAVTERLSDHLAPAERDPSRPRERLWKVRAGQVVLATGSFERPMIFANNDLPGIMLASAAAGYAHRHAVQPGSTAVVFGNNDSLYASAAALHHAGVRIAALVDTRADAAVRDAYPELAGALMPSAAVVAARGGRTVREVLVAPLADEAARLSGRPVPIECDLVCMAGGWNPVVHLFSQSGGSLRFDTDRQCFVPGASRQAERSAGACNGAFDLAGCLAEGARTGALAASDAGFGDGRHGPMPEVRGAASCGSIAPIREIPAPAGFGRRSKFVDFLNDVTVADLNLAAREGYGAPEHAKRYTTAGMGVDQGRTGNVNALAVLGAAQGGRSPADLGTTTFRPPYSPVTFGTLAGRGIADLYDPLRRTPISAWHEEAGAVLEPVGRWRRPAYYPRAGEDMAAAVRRECLAVRSAVTLCDASTLGKIELAGPDTVRLLDMLYTNAWGSLAVGRARYGVMLRDDGMIYDDGTTARLAEDRWFMTTTTSHADAVAGWIDEWLQCEWPHWRVFAANVTTVWACITVAGPRARELVTRVGTSVDLGREACRFMTIHQGTVAGVPCRLLRVSFTGELSYELFVPADYALPLWQALMAAGTDLGVEPIGTEALHVLRAEKGFFVVGHDTDATVSPLDLGPAAPLRLDKPDFIGKRSLARAELARSGRQQFVGLLTEDPAAVVPEGSPVVEVERARNLDRPPVPSCGRVTSSYASPALGRSICLGMVANGLARTGELVIIIDRGLPRPARIVSPRFYDPDGAKLDG